MTVEILTPDMALFKGEASAVQAPGKDGLFQVLDHHAPIISVLRAGTIKINLRGEGHTVHPSIEKDERHADVIRLNVKGGVLEMMGNKVIILAD